IVVKQGSESREDIKKFVELYQSDDVKKFIQETFKGAILPAW
ncbi:MAG: metal ABC transporter substrate-binding protein, partial [Alphaproteobacteria bacterium]|nr:metal ABC transporter substrate-binding protein [Alphaproteobacteria bacterium]